MAILSTVIKSILDGSKNPVPTTGEMKSALGSVYDFCTDLLGTDSSDKAAARYALGVPSSGGYRNVLDNATFTIDSRGSNKTALVNNDRVFDRWDIVTAGQTVTFSDQTSYKIVTAPAGGIRQILDKDNIYPGTYQAKWNGSASCLINGTAIANGGTVILANTTGQTIVFYNGTVDRPQLEPGRVAGIFEPRPIAIEQSICERWVEVSANRVIAPTGYSFVPFKTKKRSLPEITITQVTGAGSGVLLHNPTPNDFTSEYGFAIYSPGEGWSYNWIAKVTSD